ncbi:MAG: S8 family serine peptidase, partial [Bdellovibrionales bacterium]|nr:S8 family serine peptidase [Bdellovibrionales bacterium]
MSILFSMSISYSMSISVSRIFSRRYLRQLAVGIFTLTFFFMPSVGSGQSKSVPGLKSDPLEVQSRFTTIENRKHPDTSQQKGSDFVSVIVKLKPDSVLEYTGEIPGLAATSPRITGADFNLHSAECQKYLQHFQTELKAFQKDCRARIPGAKISHTFDVLFGGVTLLLPREKISEVQKLHGVKGVFADRLIPLATDRSSDYIGAPVSWQALGGRSHAGEGIVIGMLDSGVWPDHPSFEDPDPTGLPYPPPPPSWKGTSCEFSGGENPGAPFTCNNKIIGAYRFMQSYDEIVGTGPAEYTSARDEDGHGTHTASIAAGNADVSATILGSNLGKITGVAPRAHLAIYKVCGAEGCVLSDSLA